MPAKVNNHSGPACMTGRATTPRPIGHEREVARRMRFEYRKYVFRAFERLVTAHMLAQEEGEEDLLLHEAMDLTLRAAAEDAKDADFERSATSTAGQKERGPVAASSQRMELERTITPWEEWTPQATSTPHPGPTSSTSLLSPVAWGALATSTVHCMARRGSTHGVACCHHALQTSEVPRARTLQKNERGDSSGIAVFTEDRAATATALPGWGDQAVWYTWSQTIVQNASR
ncbi:uncharacterized protein C8Q71DRAFT_248972 [Rhodofomes roseus]|uniref:Uncharacterized protein n=1 Tax=Rhodofomes roseus TaxID=34475 RepID=A0ABQ8K7B9_9APHY|nr:uncharacterized protein C8Q71DRAFT_248972 [Rhodofomes roseus]KAH9833028.1 hypothetical protein C8Q71DRAFT_248972 [Rhodofomes roseus]